MDDFQERMPDRDRELLSMMLRADKIPDSVSDKYWAVKRILDRVDGTIHASVLALLVAPEISFGMPEDQQERLVAAPAPSPDTPLDVTEKAAEPEEEEEEEEEEEQVSGLLNRDVQYFDPVSGEIVEGVIRSIDGDEDGDDCICHIETEDGEMVQKLRQEIELV